MIQDITGLPLAGGGMIGGTAYVALSLFVTGPLIAERTIEKSGWQEDCARRTQVTSTLSPAPPPTFDCETVLGALYGREGANYCARYGQSLAGPLGMLGALAERTLGSASRRTEDYARRAGSACTCATAFVVENRRFEFALYAGTARLVTPPPVRELSSELDRALSSPICRIEE